MQYGRVSLYAMMLASAGIPLYIHLPQFASVELGIGLAAVGGILLAIRLVDLVQDPLIGWMVDRWPGAQLWFAMGAACGLAIGFPLLYGLQPGPNTTLHLVAILIMLFTAYSLGTILLYGRSATLAAQASPGELVKLAAYREGGMLTGVILTAVAPAVLVMTGAPGTGYAEFGLGLGVFALLTSVLTQPIWKRTVVTGHRLSLTALNRAGATRLLVLAVLNSLPVALTSTLFLFFTEDHLQLQGFAGALLVLFFASAGISVPVWAALSRRIGPRATLLTAMPLAITGFAGAAFLGPGDLLPFALISIASGAAIGADMVLLPAMFSIALTQAGLSASTAFGIWSFAGKFALALAAAFALPLLELQGFNPGQANDARALTALIVAYAVLPCLLKALAFGFAFTLPSERSAP